MKQLVNPQTIIASANRFRIWRIAVQCGWKCSPMEIAKELGLSLSTVVKTLSAQGWSARLRYDRGDKRKNHVRRDEADKLVPLTVLIKSRKNR